MWREPVDATIYEPNAIISNAEHPSIRPRRPEDYGVARRPDRRRDAPGPQRRAHLGRAHGVAAPADAQDPATGSSSRRRSTAGARTPPRSTPTGSRCCSARSATSTAATRACRGRARRTSRSTPATPRTLGVEDGDYIWVDADPTDRPFRGWKEDDAVLRGRPRDDARARLPGHAAGRHPHLVQHVRRHAGHRRRPGARARARRRRTRAPATSRCSATAATSPARGRWLRPTQMTDSLVRKALLRPGRSARASSPTCTRRRRTEGVVRARSQGRGRRRRAASGSGVRSTLGLRPQAAVSEAMTTLPRRRLHLTRGGARPWRRSSTGSSGREMDYPYEAHRPEAAVLHDHGHQQVHRVPDLHDGLQDDLDLGQGQEYMLWNNVETKPFGFYPTGWDVNVLELLGPQSGTATTTRARRSSRRRRTGERVLGWQPDEADWNHPNLGEDEPHRRRGGRRTYIPDMPHRDVDLLPAAHLQPLHLSGVPRRLPAQAIYKRQEDGIVLIDQERCRGYQECVQGLPLQEVDVQPRDPRLARSASAASRRSSRASRRSARRRASARSASPASSRPPDKADPAQPDRLPRARAQGRAAALPAVRARAERLLHPADPRAGGVLHAAVRPGGRAGDRDLQGREGRPRAARRC